VCSLPAGHPNRCSAAPAMDESLVEIGVRVLFRHPLVRSAVYRSASYSDLLEVHGALALATDRDADPDRRAWHMALATNGSDGDVANELESSAKRAQARGGLAAAAVFFEWAAKLSPATEDHARRLLSAATAKRDVGDLDAALGLLAAAESGSNSRADDAKITRLRGQIAFDRRHLEDGIRLFTEAARAFERLDPPVARRTLARLCLLRFGEVTLMGSSASGTSPPRSPHHRRRLRRPDLSIDSSRPSRQGSCTEVKSRLRS
jgi:hypothetical protein